jgi:glycosyltransferase involved in cell wall biosynthesis
MTVAATLEGAPRHLLHVFPSFAVGGSQVRFGQLVKLHGKRYRHTVIALDGVCTMAAQLPEGAPIGYERPPPQTVSALASVTQAIDILKEIRPDVLVTYNWGSFNWWVAKHWHRDLPHIHIEDGFGPEERRKQFRRRMWARRLVLRERLTKVVLPSRRLVQIAQTNWGLPPRQLHYIPNGIEWRRFASERDVHAGAAEVVLGTVATLRPEKNLIRLVKLFNAAAALRPQLRPKLLIVGDGSESAAIK